MLPLHSASSADIEAPVAAPRAVTSAADRRYRVLFDRAPLAYVVTNAAGVIQHANRAAAVLLKRPAELLVTQSLGEIVMCWMLRPVGAAAASRRWSSLHATSANPS